MKRTTVLNTRREGQAYELTQLLLDAGFAVIEAPAITVDWAWDAAEQAAVRRDLEAGAFAWVVLASENAGRGLDRLFGGARVVCGAATAKALGLRPEIALERFSAAAALEALRDRVTPGERILVPRAAEGRPELVDGLRALAARVDAPVAYRTVAAIEAADELPLGHIDVVTLCSPSAVQSVKGGVLPSTLVVCLGDTTADAARAAGLRVDAVAASTSMPALVAAVKTALGVRT